MTQKTTLEVIAQSVEEAIDRGLAQLGINRDAVDVEILDSGSKGFLGLGGRQARVRLTLKDGVTASPASEMVEDVLRVEETVESPVEETPVPEGDEGIRKALVTGQQVVSELLEKMKINAEVTTRYVPPSDEKDQAGVLVEVHGNDLSILIGRRSEVLNALQYISSLIVSKEVGHWIPILIDVQGYRTRRERQLRMLARRMADQAVQSGKRQVLEPMPPSERRIIHLELRNHVEVDTESVGEEPYRKVTIIPKH